MTLVRPLLRLLNRTANVLVQRLGATPVDELASGQDVAGLRQLVEHSALRQASDAALANVNQQLSDLYSSTSWRLTRPLRTVVKRVRGR